MGAARPAGNPTALLVLFVPDSEVVFRDQVGAELAANAHRFVSRLAAGRYLGYLKAQKAAMTGQAGPAPVVTQKTALPGPGTVLRQFPDIWKLAVIR